MTVRGAVDPSELGRTLSHEHVLVDFIGAEKFSRDRYDADAVFETVLPYLTELKDLGCECLVECTPNYLGRDPNLLKRLSEASGLHLLTNTGYYGARDNLFLPPHAFEETADQLAKRWIAEWTNGIEDSGVRPGFIKIGVDGPNLSPIHQKLVRAAARTHLQTGLTIASHTGKGDLALQQLNILREEGVASGAFIWVHAQAEPNMETQLKVADSGCWVSWDGFQPRELTRYIELCKTARAQGWFDRLLISHDAGWYSPGEPDGGSFRGFDPIFKLLIPRLRDGGFSNEEIDQLMIKNPAQAFRVTTRR